MDVSGVGLCTLCALPMLGGQPKMELMCAHIFHTECVVLHWYDEEMSCPTCQHNVFNRDVRELFDTRHRQSKKNEEDKFLEEYAQNKQLKKDIQLIKKQIAKARKARSSFNKLGTQRRREWKQETKPLFQLLIVKQKDMIRGVQMSPQLKQWTTERKKLTRLVNQFQTKYTQYRFHSLLQYRSLKLPSIWDYRGLTSMYRWRLRRYFRMGL